MAGRLPRSGLDASTPLMDDEIKRSTPPTLVSVPAITLTVNCRDLRTTLRVGAGEQTFKWLAFVVRDLYASRFPEYRPEQLTPILVCDSSRRPLFPDCLIKHYVPADREIFVDLIGPKDGVHGDSSLSRQRSLWELCAFAPPSSFVPVTLFFDASEMPELQGDTVDILGSFNGWDVPIPMKPVFNLASLGLSTNDAGTGRGLVFAHTVKLPADADICFLFVANDRHIVSSHYNKVLDEQGQEMNCIKVAKPHPQPLTSLTQPSRIYATYINDKLARPTPGLKPGSLASQYVDPMYALNVAETPVTARSLAAEGGARGGGLAGLQPTGLSKVPLRVPTGRLPITITGVFEGVPRLSDDMQRKLFETDWTKIRLLDFVKTKAERHEVKDALWHRIDDLRVVFRHYAGMVSDAMNNMSTITLAQVLRACGVTDRQLSEARWEKIFNRQGLSDDLEEEQALLQQRPTHGLAASSSTPTITSRPVPLTASQDPLNPDKFLTRADFLEALARVAFSRLAGAEPAAEALERLFTFFFSIAMVRGVNDYRAKLLDASIQRLIMQYSTRLWGTFVEFASPAMVQPANPRDRKEKRLVSIRLLQQKDWEVFLKEMNVCEQATLPLGKANACFRETYHANGAISLGSSSLSVANASQSSSSTATSSEKEKKATSSASTLQPLTGDIGGEINFIGFLELLARVSDVKFAMLDGDLSIRFNALLRSLFT